MKPFMSYSFKKNDERRSRLINLGKPQEVTYWSKKWEISSPQLYQAFKESGSNSVIKIETYLRQKGLVS
ncbi:MAG TPA: DUF3606 domain-containing protein [Flavitalea sp.]|nr:DUF3606 domain-containing protein [Flavitalea sp.]